MKQVILAICCSAALIVSPVAHAADTVSDKDMADRYTLAAVSGDSDAQFYLGALYSSAIGRARSDEEAFKWFSRAADQGHSHAMLVLSGLTPSGAALQKTTSAPTGGPTSFRRAPRSTSIAMEAAS